MLQQPPAGERINQPRKVQPHALHFVMFQAAPRKADLLATRFYDLGFTNLVAKKWADWAWEKAFPNAAEELSRWLAGFRKKADWNEYFRQFLAGLGRIGVQPIETSQLVTLALVMDYSHRQTSLPYQPKLAITFGRVDGKPHLREINLSPRLKEFAIDFSGVRLAGLGNLGKISVQIKARSQPSGELWLSGAANDPVLVTGAVSYELQLTFVGINFTSACNQPWRVTVSLDNNGDPAIKWVALEAQDFQ